MDKREFSLKLYRISDNKLYYLVTAYSQTDAIDYLLEELGLETRDKSNYSIKEIDISTPGLIYNETMVMSITQQKEYSASDVAKMIGTTPNMIGRIANKLKIKSKTSCNQYGRWVSSKSRYSSKEITQWMYYQTAIDLIRNTFSKKNKKISYQESLFGEDYEKHN